MYNYIVSSYYYDTQQCGEVYTVEYLCHKKQYTKEEFDSICNIALKACGRDQYEIEKYLIENFGFFYLEIEGRFEFNKDENLEDED
jgi:hypothetical protein